MGNWFSFYWVPAPAVSQCEKPMETTATAQNGTVVDTPQLSSVTSGRDDDPTTVNNTFACCRSASEQRVRPIALPCLKGPGKACNVTGDHVVAPCTCYNTHTMTSQHLDTAGLAAPSSRTLTFDCHDPQGVRTDLLKTLKELRLEQFKDFKWYLQQPDIMGGYHTITVSDLEKAERRDTVDLMVQTCGFHGALEVTRKVLEKINRNDLVQSPSDTSSATEG